MAQKLGRTVGELRAIISNHEYVLWTRYYARRAQREQLAQREAAP